MMMASLFVADDYSCSLPELADEVDEDIDHAEGRCHADEEPKHREQGNEGDARSNVFAAVVEIVIHLRSFVDCSVAVPTDDSPDDSDDKTQPDRAVCFDKSISSDDTSVLLKNYVEGFVVHDVT
jgi:hypothetical protein